MTPTLETIVERVARAIWDAREKTFPEDWQRSFDDLTNDASFRPDLIARAIAALRVMRTPSAGMVAAALPIRQGDDPALVDIEAKRIGAAAVLRLSGAAKTDPHLEGQAVLEAADLVQDWRAMIDAALVEAGAG